MPIPRLHLFELEDQPWFPKTIRDLATDYLHFMEATFSLHRPVVTLLADVLRTTRTDHIVDLCSGGAGPVPALHKALAAQGLAVRFALTDRFPNVPAFEQAAAAAPGAIEFVADSVDARAVPAALTGFRTLFNSFHHFRPTDAVAVLRDAAQARQPIGVFEIPDRRLPAILPFFFLTPFMVGLATPFIRPFRWRRLLWTYLVPLVPLTCWWDGAVSALRAYTVTELKGLADEVQIAGYTWRAGQVPIGSAPGRLTYLIGYPGGL
ncbi:MAG TPA: hypothetical protein VKD71_04480 [Gemmataceae bacterium]|nr:hypothetical protein [Gemmataceae bacterium]